MDVKRYDLEDNYSGFLCHTSMEENRDGDWVKYEDYEKLLSDYRKLKVEYEKSLEGKTNG